MRTNFFIDVKVAGINIHFISDVEVDICDLRNLFKYHLISNSLSGGIHHCVEFRTVNHFKVPKDSRLVWEGTYHGVGCKKNHNNKVRKYISEDGKTEYFVTTKDAYIIIDLATGDTVCAMRNKQKQFQSKYVRSTIGAIIILLIHVVMAYHRRYALHASSVVWREKAIVFTGGSGRGKSTLCSDLVAKGAGFLGDDIVFAYLENGKVRIASLLFDAKLFESRKKSKDFIDIIKRHGCEKIDSAPLQAIVDTRKICKGETTVAKEIDEDQLLGVFLTAANNIALQYDYEDWLTLCACIMEDYCLYTINFGDRNLLKISILDNFYAPY